MGSIFLTDYMMTGIGPYITAHAILKRTTLLSSGSNGIVERKSSVNELGRRHPGANACFSRPPVQTPSYKPLLRARAIIAVFFYRRLELLKIYIQQGSSKSRFFQHASCNSFFNSSILLESMSRNSSPRRAVMKWFECCSFISSTIATIAGSHLISVPGVTLTIVLISVKQDRNTEALCWDGKR